MLNKILQVYENKILSEKTKKDLGWLGWGYIILGVVCLVSFLIFEIIHSYVAAVISITLLVVVSVAFIIVSNKLFKYDEQNLKQYKTETFYILLFFAFIKRKYNKRQRQSLPNLVISIEISVICNIKNNEQKKVLFLNKKA